MSTRPGMGVSVSVHADATTLIASKLLTVDGQPCPILRVEGARDYVAVFADRPELIRLRDAIDNALADLDSAQARESAA
ncbi:hypothetical protein [Pseudonocardia adelaidensis]|uniref:Uncharacterized protein n=1 Tax=Pseudonocardia adelaidensis TaxID=648754 RepID=A0ABP9P1V3_9PSEU